jgi:hypothetical protein
VKNIKFAVLAFGVLGLVGLLMSDILGGLKHDAVNTILVLAGFAAPAAMAGMALKGPFQRWQAGVALAGFALVAIKLRVWQTIKFLSLLPMGLKLALVACVVGLIVSAIAVAKPDDKA